MINTALKKVHPKEEKKTRFELPFKDYELRVDKYGPNTKSTLGKLLFTKDELDDGSKTE